MTAVARLFAFTLMLVVLGSLSACITTLFLVKTSGGDAQSAAGPARSVDVTAEAFARPHADTERSDHNCNLMRF